MRATALQPPPPTPITLMRVPRCASSSISYFRSSMSESISAIRFLLAPVPLLQNFSVPAGALTLFLHVQLEVGRIHGQARRRGPLRIPHVLGQLVDVVAEAETRAALQDALGDIAKIRQAGRGAGQEHAAHQRAIHAD